MQLTIQKKIKKIRKCRDYSQMAWDWFPPAHSDEYYFVSYSHKDYKEVFADIYALQSEGLQLWYDRELRAGKDWETEARTHINDFKCKGVIFYVSANSAVSESVHREIEFVKRSGKNYLSINLPVGGEYLSAAEIWKRVGGGTEEQYQALCDMFGDTVTYLKYGEEPARRAQHIRRDLIPQPLLNFCVQKRKTMLKTEKERTVVTGINDLHAVRIKEADLIFCGRDGKPLPIVGIETCAFANCRSLEEIQLPETLKYIASYAFYSCISLKSVVLPKDVEVVWDSAFYGCTALEKIQLPDALTEIGESTFYGCTSLKEIALPAGVSSVGDSTFYGCTALKAVSLPPKLTKIGEEAFYGCTALESIALPEGVTAIGRSAFMQCTSLKTVVLPAGLTELGAGAFMGCASLEAVSLPAGVTEIPFLAFGNCTSLKQVALPANLTKIEGGAFRNCPALERIDFGGTTQTWKKICEERAKGKQGEYTVFCTDGMIANDGTVTLY